MTRIYGKRMCKRCEYFNNNTCELGCILDNINGYIAPINKPHCKELRKRAINKQTYLNTLKDNLIHRSDGVTTTSGFDIYSFTGINTVGSASTTANYAVLGVVNGGFR